MASIEAEQAFFEREATILPEIPTQIEVTEEPSRALFLLPPADEVVEERPALGPRQHIRKVAFNRHMATMVLNLDERVVSEVLDNEQLADLAMFDFEPKPHPHITVVNFDNGRRIIRALDGERRKIAAVRAEAHRVDWSWRPTDVLVPFQGRQQGRLKLVNIVECPGSDDFYDRLEDSLPGLQLERHPMHITLMRGPNALKHRNIIIGGVALGAPLHTLDHLKPSAQ